VSSISPANVTAGAAATTLTVTGTGFLSSTNIQVGGTVEPTTYVSATQVTAAVPASQLASGVLLSVIALNGSVTSAAGTPVNLEVDNPSPKISGLLPNSIPTGSASTSVAVTGTGFVPSTTIQVGGAARSTTFVSATQVNVILTVADLATPGNLSLVAVNPTPGGGTSAASSIAINNPLPTITALAPSVLTTGATSATTVTVNGTGFLPSSVVQIIGTTSSNRATTYISSTQLTFQLTVADQSLAARLSISVFNPTPGGGNSAISYLTLSAPTPTPVIAQVSPTSFLVGSGASTIIVVGTNLTTTSTILWNGTPLTTTYISSPYYGLYLGGTVPASLLTTVGTASITVSSPTATPSVSNAVSVPITNPPAPTLTSLSPSSGPINTATTITLTGTGFTAASTVAYNGVNVTATYVSSTQLTVALPAASVTAPGNGSFTVTTPAPGGGISAALVYTAYIGLVNNSMVYNPVNGLFYVSVPSSAGAPYGNSIVSVDPATGAFGTPIPVGSEPNKLAISSDGTILWVGLDGASAVRQVNLTTNTAGLQFTLGGNSGIYANPGTAIALAALPGSPNSVVVSATNEFSGLNLAIYDSGVLRGTPSSTNYSYNSVYALLTNSAKGEIYAGGSSYDTYTYNAAGLTLKAASTTSATYASSSADEMQIAGSQLITDSGKVFDPESGSLLGSFYSSGTTLAAGPTVADITLGEAFVLYSTTTTPGSYNQIQVFNLSNYNLTSSAPIPVSASGTSTTYPYYNYASRLTRWGTNGLAFRTNLGVYSLRSNLVKDLSTTNADLGVTIASSGTNVTGSNTTFVATVTNAGPSASTNATLTAALPASGSLVSVTSSAGSCSTSNGVNCDLGGLASGASATATFVITQATAGSSTLTVQVSGSENDPNNANNQASSTVTVTGNPYNLAPALTSISPASILAGSSATVITVTGTGFTSGSSILLNGATLPTNYTSATQLTATVPATQLTTLGWMSVTVTTPAPGGGVTSALPLSVYSVITLGVNHILYDPYSRKIMASVGSGSATVAGNSIVAITPETATVGSPVNIGSQPTNLALTSDGQILYTVLGGSESVARFNMLTQQADFTYAVPAASSYFSLAIRSIAAQPGTENTIALDLGEDAGNAIYDFNPTTKTAAIRGAATGSYTGSCLAFLDAADLFSFDIDTTGYTVDHYTVTSSGFSYYNYSQYTQSTLNGFGCFKLNGGLAFGNAGGVANPATVPATQLGVFANVSGGGTFSSLQALAPDTSLQRAFYIANTLSTSTNFDGISAYNPTTFLKAGALSLNIPAYEGNTSYSGVDLIRWGQDGLALLTSTGHIYLMRGAFVVPQLLNQNTAATLTSGPIALTHGIGNGVLTLTGTNFIPGVAVTWNGAYRTTTIVDATHVTVAIPASDFAAAGTASLVATNPGATASNTVTVTIN
jgi:hypothetical protein